MGDDRPSSQRPKASSGLDKNVSYWTMKEHLRGTLRNLEKSEGKHHRVIYWCDQGGSSEDSVKAREILLLERTEVEIGKVKNLIEVIANLEDGNLTPDKIDADIKKQIIEIHDQLAPAPAIASPTSIHSRLSPRSANRSANEDEHAAFEEMMDGIQGRLESQREDAENENQEDEAEAEEEQENEEYDADNNASKSREVPSTASPTSSEIIPNPGLHAPFSSFSGFRHRFSSFSDFHPPDYEGSDLPDYEDSDSNENSRGPAQPHIFGPPEQRQDEQRQDINEALIKIIEDQKAIHETCQAAFEAQNKRVKDLERSPEGMDKQLEKVYGTLEANDKKIEGLETSVGHDVGFLTARVKAGEEQLKELRGEIENMKEHESGLINDVASLTEQVKDGNELVAELKDEITSIKEKNSGLENGMASLTTQVQDGNERFTNLKDEVHEALKAKDKKIEGLENDVASLTAQTKSGSEQVAELKGEIEKLKEAEAERVKTVDSLVEAYVKLSMQVSTVLAERD